MRIRDWKSSIIKAIRVRLSRAKRRHIRRLLAAAAVVPVLVVNCHADELAFSAATRFVDDTEHVITADFNGDGAVDIATGNRSSFYDLNDVTVLLGNGDGSFGAPTDFDVGFSSGYSIAAGDFNGDGLDDMVATSYYHVGVLISLGNGDFAQSSINVGGVSRTIRTADINGDGFLDAVTGTYGSLEFNLGQGDGSFGQATSLPVGEHIQSIATTDFDGDGITDIAVAPYYGDRVIVFLGNGDGSFGSPSTVVLSENITALVADDFNGDGIPDVAVCRFEVGTYENVILLGLGDGTFDQPEAFPAGEGAFAITAADFNGDGTIDLANAARHSITVLLGNGDGTFEPPQIFSTPQIGGQCDIAHNDLNGDGWQDLISVSSFGRVSIFLNETICGPLLGDVNQDGAVNLLDVAPFVALLASGEFQEEADINQDGVVNTEDVTPFVNLLTE